MLRIFAKVVKVLVLFGFHVTIRKKQGRLINTYFFNMLRVTKYLSINNFFLQMLGDRNFYIDIIRAIKLHSAGSKANIFCYRFNYRGKYSLSNVYMNKFDDYG